MKLPVASFEVADLRHVGIGALLPPADADVWNVWNLRQQRFPGIHGQTRSIVFRWLEPTWTPRDPLEVVRDDYAGPELCAAVDRCATALEARYKGVAVRLMLAELGPGCEIRSHVDQGLALVLPHRCHVPVRTNPQVEFWIDNERHHFREGIAYEFDNTRPHSVVNRGATARVHLICDVLPGYAIALRP